MNIRIADPRCYWTKRFEQQQYITTFFITNMINYHKKSVIKKVIYLVLLVVSRSTK